MNKINLEKLSPILKALSPANNSNSSCSSSISTSVSCGNHQLEQQQQQEEEQKQKEQQTIEDTSEIREMRSTTSYGSEMDARVAAASAAAIAYALELKPKIDTQPSKITHQPQKIKKLVRRNASDKLKLIQMVHDNPILWDSRLPNFKGAEEEKNHAWELIGKEFNAPGRRVARAFKSLRESYRRELAHVKLMGNGFKPKWSLYEAMDFLRDVIRERKGGSHAAADHNVTPIGLNLSAFAQHLNGTFHNNNNNSNSSNSNNNNNNNNNNQFNYKLPENNTFTDAALNLTKCATTSSNRVNGNCSGVNGSGNGVNRPDYYYNFVKTELDLSQQQHSLQHQQPNTHNNTTASLNITQISPTISNNHKNSSNNNINSNNSNNNDVDHIPAAHQNSHNDSSASSTHNDATMTTTTAATIPNINNTPYLDNVDDASIHSGDGDGDGEEATSSLHHLASTSHHESDEVEELDAIDADFPYPLILNSSNSPIINGGGRDGSGAGPHDHSRHLHFHHNVTKRKRKYLNSEDDDANTGSGHPAGNGNRDGKNIDGDGGDDDDDGIVFGYGGHQQPQYHHQQQQQQQQYFHRHLRDQNSYDMSRAQALMAAGGMDMLPPPQTIREVLNTKFCGFISAKLNSMEDSEADNLMNKILMLLVQTQTSNQTVTQSKTITTPAVQIQTSLTSGYGAIATACTSASTSMATAKKCNSNDNK